MSGITTVNSLNQSEIPAADLLSGAATIPRRDAYTCELNPGWLTPAGYLDWARRGLRENDPYGLSNAIAYSKRAACCRIDRLIRNYHLRNLHRANFGVKIDALKGIGLPIPDVIQELVINPRNEIEHDYTAPNLDKARHAVDIASLFRDATDSLDAQGSVIALNMNILHSSGVRNGKAYVTFNGWMDGVMLFMDVFEEPHRAKIIDGARREVRFADLKKFKPDEAMELAKILRSHHSEPSRGARGNDEFFYMELKKLAGF